MEIHFLSDLLTKMPIKIWVTESQYHGTRLSATMLVGILVQKNLLQIGSTLVDVVNTVNIAEKNVLFQ